ncbi:MAG: Ig protein [uncultured bacterium]|nr:MAG: Ig protein [uncultured bacterium]
MIKLLKLSITFVILGIITLFATNNAYAANISEFTLTPDSTTPAVSTNHTVTFRTSSVGAIPQGGMIKITYPAGFNLNNVTLGGYSGNLGNPTITKVVDTVFLTLDSTSNIGNSSLISFQLLHVINSSANGNYSVNVETRNSSGQNIDGPNQSALFTIGQVQTLDHFNVVPSVTNTTVGNDVNLTITAQNNSNNTITSYNGTPALSGLATSPNATTPYYGPIVFTNGIANVTIRSYSSQANQFVTVTDNGKTGNSGVINFAFGTLGTINITPSSTQTIIAGQTIQFTVTGTDSYGNIRAGDTFIWTNANNTGLFSNTLAGTYQIKATSGSISSSSVNVTINPAALDHITISPNSNQTIKAGDTLQFTASAYDQFGNVRNDVIFWVGTNSNGLFTTNLVGTYDVNATVGNISSTNTIVTVKHAETINHLTISPINTHLSNTDQSQTYIVWALDQYGNSWDISNQASFSTTDPKGAFSNNIYNAGKVGTWQVTATYGNKSITTSVTIDNPGVPSRIDIISTTEIIYINTIHQFSANAYDADNNLLSNPNLAWIVVEGLDNATIDSTGRFMANKVGNYKVKVISGNASQIFSIEVKDISTKSTNSITNKSEGSIPNSTTTSISSTKSPGQTTIKENKDTIVEVADDSLGKIKASEIVTEGLEAEEVKNTNRWLLTLSIIIGLAILGLSYWGYTIWSVPIEETLSESSMVKPINNINIDKSLPKESIDKQDDKTRW